jgi:hypothetical protein
MQWTDSVYRVPQRLLDESRAFLRSRGEEDYEGTALWAGRPVNGLVELTRIIVPDQVAVTTALGAYVDLTPEAHYTLPDLLAQDERFYARIHSHPGRAYHSARDDANEVISHRGALSIVVPYFAREPIQLDRCAVYRLEHGLGWLPLTPEAIRQRFEVIL